MQTNFSLKDKVALITGANRGIGKSIVESFLKEGVAKVYAAVRNKESAAPLVDAHGHRVEPIHIDFEAPETIPAAAEKANDVSIVVNNAGVLRTANPLADDAIEALQFEMEINVFGLIRMANAFAPPLKNNGDSAFVQLNSIAALKSFPDFATYCASKAAAYSITQALHDLFGQQCTRVLSVHPGPIATDMAANAGFGDMAEPVSVVSEGIITALKNGEFHLFPDSMAKMIGTAYESFAKNIVEANLMEG